MRVAVIGAGAAGLVSAKNVLEGGFDCVILENTDHIGGLWCHEKKDEDGVVLSVMYDNLRTNLPKEVMEFDDFPVRNATNSFMTQKEVADYLHKYANNFNLWDKIQFGKCVVDIKRVEDNRWQVIMLDKYTNSRLSETYDAVMVCSGIYNDPEPPKIAGQRNFKGKQIHSSQYRKPEDNKEKSVLVIGAGPSGIDIAHNISRHAKKVVVSSKNQNLNIKCAFSNMKIKPTVRNILEKKALFVDGTEEDIDTIIYCTGYKYYYPFISYKVGITMEEQHVYPLYKHMFNAEYPTMCFIGVPFQVLAFKMFHLQSKVFVKYLSNSFQLPSSDEMCRDIDNEIKSRFARGLTEKHLHGMLTCQSEYYSELSTLAGLPSIPPVMIKVFVDAIQGLYEDYNNFRDYNYSIVNKDTFTKTKV